jgi:hypothetical protein
MRTPSFFIFWVLYCPKNLYGKLSIVKGIRALVGDNLYLLQNLENEAAYGITIGAVDTARKLDIVCS